MAWQDRLNDLGACHEARKWADSYATAQQAWDACERADWMLWLLARVAPKDSAERRLATRCAVLCARTALPYYQTEADRAEGAAILDAVDAWATGQAPETDLTAVRRRAYDLRSKLWRAAAAAAYAAVAAYAAAAYAAAYAAAAADAAALRGRLLKECADLIRKEAPAAPI